MNLAFKCTCPTGYSGTQCEKNDNGCLPDSCLNNATCEDTSYGHVCNCAPGYAGSQCDVNINDCSSRPCQNNGQCVDQVNGYKCYCAPSFKGTNCETGMKILGNVSATSTTWNICVLTFVSINGITNFWWFVKHCYFCFMHGTRRAVLPCIMASVLPKQFLCHNVNFLTGISCGPFCSRHEPIFWRFQQVAYAKTNAL